MDDIKQCKPKKTVEEQISHMKNKGITFNYISDEEARKYLSEHTFYFKFKAYAKNYEKYNTNGKYINLDFSYLQDLARLDMYFREIVLKITIDIEHYLKVQILSESQKNDKDDGYKIVEDFLYLNTDIQNKITSQSKNGYHCGLICKYYPVFPIWVFLEIISFGDLIKFYEFYNKEYPIVNNVSRYLWSARILRNAAAHNSCILNRLTEKFEDKAVNGSLMDVLRRNYSNLGSGKIIKKYLKNPVIQDFIDVLILYSMLDKNKTVLKKRSSEIDKFFRRCRKHASFYKKNLQIRYAAMFAYKFYQEYRRINLMWTEN